MNEMFSNILSMKLQIYEFLTKQTYLSFGKISLKMNKKICEYQNFKLKFHHFIHLNRYFFKSLKNTDKFSF